MATHVIDVGLWRTLNVLIGIVIALAFSFALPLHATYSWRYGIAANLRECARIYTRLLEGETIGDEEQVKRFLEINRRLVQLRSLMPSVAKRNRCAAGEARGDSALASLGAQFAGAASRPVR